MLRHLTTASSMADSAKQEMCSGWEMVIAFEARLVARLVAMTEAEAKAEAVTEAS